MLTNDPFPARSLTHQCRTSTTSDVEEIRTTCWLIQADQLAQKDL